MSLDFEFSFKSNVTSYLFMFIFYEIYDFTFLKILGYKIITIIPIKKKETETWRS